MNLGNIAFNTNLKDFDKYFVGFDGQFEKLAKFHDDVTKNIPSYPPYNIRKTGENKYLIEIAVAGFANSDIEIELDDGKLMVKGISKADGTSDDYLFKGIANRAFSRAFQLDDTIEVYNAELINGMLKIFLERLIPEHKKPKKIEVKNPSSKRFLTEEEQDNFNM